jgi:hypothetical protein
MNLNASKINEHNLHSFQSIVRSKESTDPLNSSDNLEDFFM